MSEKNLSLIVYKDAERPKYYELKSSYLKFILTALPLITFICLAALVTGAIYFKQIRLAAQKKEPAIIQDLRNQLGTLQEESQSVFELNKQLETKLAQSQDFGPNVATLTLFKSTLGQQDLSNSPIISVEDFQIEKMTQDSIDFKFNLINLEDDGTRQSGYIFVMLVTGQTFTFYPNDAISTGDTQLTFNKGEYFSAARFRPVEATLPLPRNKGSALFKILIFSRTGDLLTKKIHQANLSP